MCADVLSLARVCADVLSIPLYVYVLMWYPPARGCADVLSIPLYVCVC